MDPHAERDVVGREERRGALEGIDRHPLVEPCEHRG
jgi:hypothetical protein